MSDDEMLLAQRDLVESCKALGVAQSAVDAIVASPESVGWQIKELRKKRASRNAY